MFDDVMLRFPIFFRSLKMQLPRSLQEKYKVTENEIGGRLWKSFIISRSHVFEAILNKKCVIDIMYLTNFTPVVFPGGIIIGATVAKTTGTFSSFTNSNNTGQNLNLVNYLSTIKVDCQLTYLFSLVYVSLIGNQCKHT